MAARLGLTPKTDFTKGQEAALGDELITKDGVTLVCWEHNSIPAIVASLPKSPAASKPFPTAWPGSDRFDIVWVFDLAPDASGYIFSTVLQMLLDGDKMA